MSLAQLRYFVAVAEEGHVGRAAEALRVAQPAVSRQIHKLEDELAAILFVRTPRGMQLSGDGEVLLPRAREILERVEQAAAALRRVDGAGDAHRQPIGFGRPTPIATGIKRAK